jgi:hypothetical protein
MLRNETRYDNAGEKGGMRCGVGGLSSSFMFTEFAAIMMPIYHCNVSRIV